MRRQKSLKVPIHKKSQPFVSRSFRKVIFFAIFLASLQFSLIYPSFYSAPISASKCHSELPWPTAATGRSRVGFCMIPCFLHAIVRQSDHAGATLLFVVTPLLFSPIYPSFYPAPMSAPKSHLSCGCELASVWQAQQVGVGRISFRDSSGRCHLHVFIMR